MSGGDQRDPREALRRYLEQRRELGEQEMVLDGMSVEEAMRLIGLASGPLKNIGDHHVQVQLHTDIKAEILVTVLPDNG